jgi:hypothetical protein
MSSTRLRGVGLPITWRRVMASVDRQDIMLLIADGADGTFLLDPIRLMKGCFIVAEIGPEEWKHLFEFSPYDYGPFDPSVYRARDALVGKDLLEAMPAGRYSHYAVTSTGRERAQEIAKRMDQRQAQWLRNIGHWVTSKSFNDLLREIYDRFPNYASRSIANV